MGAGLKEDQGLRGLWETVCSQPFEETQDLQRELLERARAKKRPQAVGSRIDQLRALGNAVVPQVVEEIGRAILEAERRMTPAHPATAHHGAARGEGGTE